MDCEPTDSTNASTLERIPYSAEQWRKALHVLALLIPLLMPVVGKWQSAALLGPLVALALSADVLRVRSAWFAAIIARAFGFMMRRCEVPAVGGPVRINGASWVLFSSLLLVCVFPVHIASIALATCILSDAAAALVGRRCGRRTWPRSRRTVEGTVAFVLVGLAVIGLFDGIAFWIGAVGVLLAATAEIWGDSINDNLRVPLVCAIVFFVLERYVLRLDVHLF